MTAAVERELSRQLRALDPAPAARPARKPRPGITVRWSVRRPDGGLPFVFEYTAPAGQWQTTAEHDAKIAACVRLARECSRGSWQHPEDRAEFLRLKREAMNDARAWRLKP